MTSAGARGKTLAEMEHVLGLSGDLHRQLVLAAREVGLRTNAGPADYEAIHRAIVAGSLGLIGMKDDRADYIGVRNLRFRIFPGSRLSSRPGLGLPPGL